MSNTHILEEPRLRVYVEDAQPHVIYMDGELDYENCSRVGDSMQEILGRCDGRLHLDLGDLTFIDSSGLRVLIIAAQDATETGCEFRVVSLTPQLDRLLIITGTRDLFDIPDGTTPTKDSRPTDEHYNELGFGLEPTASACHDGREQICAYARQFRFNTDMLDDIKLAAGEALSNAIRHGQCVGHCIEVLCSQDANGLVIKIEYPSSKFDPDNVPSPDMADLPIGGMGIHFMRLFMDRVDYSFHDGRATLILEKHQIAR